jgi:hypothetical protein
MISSLSPTAVCGGADLSRSGRGAVSGLADQSFEQAENFRMCAMSQKSPGKCGDSSPCHISQEARMQHQAKNQSFEATGQFSKLRVHLEYASLAAGIALCAIVITVRSLSIAFITDDELGPLASLMTIW